MYAFDIERPSSIADAVAALKQDEAQALGGGQTLIPTLKQRLASPSALVSLATVSPTHQPEARTVVLRAADSTSAALEIYTDLQSDKIASLRATPKASSFFTRMISS